MGRAKKNSRKNPPYFSRLCVPYFWFVNITIECVGVTVKAQAQKFISKWE